MRHSLHARLLVLALVVALCSIAATAWLTTRTTSAQLRGEYERTLEVDSFIHRHLLEYARTHGSWEDVGPFVADLAERTGRRVALTTRDGEIVADSSTPPFSRFASDLPPNPATEIDVSSPQAAITGGQGTGMALAVPGRLTGEELAERAPLAETATECLEDEARPRDPELLIDASGVVRLAVDQPEAAQREPLSHGVTLTSTTVTPVLSCVPRRLLQPGEAALERNERATALIRDCLDASDQPYAQVNGPYGVRSLVPAEESPDRATWQECATDAEADILERFAAQPALLYTGTVDRFDPFSGDARWRTVLTALAVLAVATTVTVLVGRRLTRPIRSLTDAVRRMASGDRDARAPEGGYDDVARLGRAFNEMAESVDAGERQRTALVSDVAHELRTPLANVRGYLEAAEDGLVPVDPDLVRLLLDESVTLQRLVDDLQDLALADAGRLRLHREECDLSELARQVVAGHRPGADEAGVSLTLEAPCRVAVDGDPVRLRQAIGNLVANAVRYTPAGGTVTVTVGRDGDRADHATVSVGDTGPGIEAEHLPHLFDRFYRAEGSRSRDTGGSGLGLAVTRHLAEAHGGSIDVASDVGDGSTFTLRVPVAPPAPDLSGRAVADTQVS